MALAPRTESMYILFTMAYALITGLTYAGFSAVVLEAIGLGAAATKYNAFASLSNMPIAYMTVVEGWAQARWNVERDAVRRGVPRRGRIAGVYRCGSAVRETQDRAALTRAAGRLRTACAPRRPTCPVPVMRRTPR